MSGFFITGTDTGVGKTLTAAAITLALQGHYWKPIQSGLEDEIADRDQVKKLTGLSDAHFYSSNYMLQASLSPDQAAELENVEIDLNLLQRKKCIIEGAGGVMVPLNNNACMLDLMQYCALPVIIVSRGTLGTINHTLLTIAALKQRQLAIQGIVFCGELNPANQATIEKWSGVKTLFHIPHFKSFTPNELQIWVAQHQQEIVESLI